MDIVTPVGRLVNKGLNSVGYKVVLKDSFVVNSEWAYRLLYFRKLFELIEDVDGDIVECGVGGGYSLAMFVVLMKSTRGRKIWGFDSFSGLPAPSREDLSSKNSPAKKGLLPATESFVWETLKNAGMEDRDSVVLMKGWFEKTLPKYQGNIALLHLDADLYESTRCALGWLWEKVVTKGIVALDEYQKTDIWPGEKIAVDEFLNVHRQSAELCFDPKVNRYYILKK